jgi:hypothetical protein
VKADDIIAARMPGKTEWSDDRRRDFLEVQRTHQTTRLPATDAGFGVSRQQQTETQWKV